MVPDGKILLEFEIMKEASRRNIPSLAVVDRATNFYFRFSRDGETVKPTAVVIPQYENQNFRLTLIVETS